MVRILILLLVPVIKVKKKMIKYWTLGFLLLVLTGSAQEKVENNSIIIWKKDRKINWNDFLSENSCQKQKGAGTAINIEFYPKKFNCAQVEKIVVIAQMNKLESWVKDKSVEILNHEQTHFDIAELYARKIRNAIQEFIEEIEGCDLQGVAEIYYRLEAEHWQTQFLYDEETKHSINSEKQQEWNIKIADSLETYKNYELIIDIEELDLE